MMQMTARHEILEAGAESVCRLSLVCLGPLAFRLRPLLCLLFRTALASENAALKSRCEAETSLPDARAAHLHV